MDGPGKYTPLPVTDVNSSDHEVEIYGVGSVPARPCTAHCYLLYVQEAVTLQKKYLIYLHYYYDTLS